MPNVYSIVTEKIVAQLEQGTIPWRKPWRAEVPCNMVSGKPYRGINVFLLAYQGYGSRYWLTFNQCAKLGGHVKKGEKSTLIVFWKRNQYTQHNEETDQDETRSSMMLRYYNVFNVMQTDLAEKLGLGNSERVADIAAAETIVSDMPRRPAIERGDRAAYSPTADVVYMPDRGLFSSMPEYYSTLFHELVHSTGHLSRLSRFEPGEPLARFGSESYSKEELIAEFGAAMLAGIAGIEQATLENSAAYLKHWIQRLKDDSKLLVSAASQAQKACDYILAKQDKPEEQEQPAEQEQELVNA